MFLYGKVTTKFLFFRTSFNDPMKLFGIYTSPSGDLLFIQTGQSLDIEYSRVTDRTGRVHKVDVYKIKRSTF